MTTDLKTTLTGIIGGIIALLAQFVLPILAEVQTQVTSIIVAITLVLLGYWTNKKDKEKVDEK